MLLNKPILAGFLCAALITSGGCTDRQSDTGSTTGINTTRPRSIQDQSSVHGGAETSQSTNREGAPMGESASDARSLNGQSGASLTDTGSTPDDRGPQANGGGLAGASPFVGNGPTGPSAAGNGTVSGQSLAGGTVPAQDQSLTNEMRSQDGGAGAAGKRDAMNIIHHTNIQLEANPYLSQGVAAMDEVQDAKAAVTESNVYLAVRLENGAYRLNEQPSDSAGDLKSAQSAHDGIRNDASRDAERAGRRGGIQSGITGNSYDYYKGKEKQHPVETEWKAGSIPAGVHRRIVEKARSLCGPNIQHIYVTDAPQLFQAFSAYEQQANGKTDWNVHINELNAMANRLFPTNLGTGAYGGSVSSGQTEHVRQHNNGPVYGERTGTK